MLIDIDADYKLTQIFPNDFETAAAPLRLVAGTPLLVPTEASGTAAFEAALPIGKSRLLAVVVPDSFPLETTLASPAVISATKGLIPVPKQADYILNVLNQVVGELERSRQTAKLKSWAFGIFDYEIVQ